MWPNCKTLFCSLHYILSFDIIHVQIFRCDFLIQWSATKIGVCDPLRHIEGKYFEARNFCEPFFLGYLAEAKPSNSTPAPRQCFKKRRADQLYPTPLPLVRHPRRIVAML